MSQISRSDRMTPLIPDERRAKSEEYQPVMECVQAEMPLVVPVTGESFCQCPIQTDLSSHTHPDMYTHECTCGEDDPVGCEWVWDDECKSSSVLLSCSNRKVSFHPDYSCGTAAMKGSRELRHGQHYWEVKMTSPVYGTDMMVGIGTAEVNLDQYRHSFCSLLGSDAHSWGLSYTGLLHHKGSKVNFSPRFGQGSIISLHLDTWHGTLSYYKNRCCIGVAATGLQNKSFYAMVCSTAAKSSMKVIRSCSAPTTLQYLCCARLRHLLPERVDPLAALHLPPGLRSQLTRTLGWVLRLGRPDLHTHTDTHTDAHGTDRLDDCVSASLSDSASLPDPDPIQSSSPYTDCNPCLDSASYLDTADRHGPASCADLVSHSDSASYFDPGPYLDTETDSDFHHDSALCPCCNTPFSLTSCDLDACDSSTSYCSCPASRPASPLPDYSCSSPTPPPDSTQYRPGSASGSNSDSCCSGTCQRKRCRWT